MIGKTLSNRYRVLRELGSGGMAWVYLAEDTKESKLVAVKVLYPQFSQDLSYVQRFNREAKLASTLTDSHIVRVLDYGADRDDYYLVMEYVEGQNLRDTLLDRGALPWREALDITDQLATALEHANAHDVVHRDIKPQNMMLTETGLLKVLDFGIARIAALPSLTQSGFVGSPYYVSPEQAMSEEVDIRSDIYSSGIVLYELLTGKTPFDAKSPWSIINQHISHEPPEIDLSNGNIPEECRYLLDRMIAKRPDDRFQNPTILRQAIASILAGQQITREMLATSSFVVPDEAGLADSLYQRALAALEVKEWDRAVDLLNQTLNYNPDYPEVSEKLFYAEHQSLLVSLYNTAQRAIRHSSWAEAIENLSGVVKLDPDYKDAAQLLEKARQGLEKEDAQKLVTSLYEEGVAHYEAGRWQEAEEAFLEVQRLSPGHERVGRFLTEVEAQLHPTFFQRLTRPLRQMIPPERRSQAFLGFLLVLAIIFLIFVIVTSVVPNAEERQAEQLKILYAQAQEAIANEDEGQAIALLEQILTENPDYADAAALRRELVATPTPTSLPTPTLAPTPTLPPTPTENPLLAVLDEAQRAVSNEQWTEALDILAEMRAANPGYDHVGISAVMCDAYVGRGLETLDRVEPANEETMVRQALADFEAGLKECPRRTDLQDQAERAEAYLQALNTPPDDYDTIIRLLNPIVAAEPTYASDLARQRLYEAYLERGQTRQQAGEMVGALGDYQAALDLPVDDPSLAQRRHAELLLSLTQQPQASPVPSPTVAEPSIVEEETPGLATSTPSPTPTETDIKYLAPELVTPENDTVFAGRLTEVFVRWQPIEGLEQDEYYDLTLMYIYADEPRYWGLATQETEVQLSPDIGVGEAGQDRFYWWVTVRKQDTAPTSDGLDLAVSPQSEIRTFIWTP